MAPLKVLICGGGVAGPALAFWLSKLGHDITLVERWPTLRTNGQQLDLRGPGIKVMNRMGLAEDFRKFGISEKGMEFVDDNGKQKAWYPVNQTGEGLQSFTTDYEMMRGDICRLLYGHTKEHVKYVFGIYVVSYTQDENSVTVTFSDGTTDQFDLMVGADGQSSRTRRMMLGPNAKDPFFYLGIYIAYFTIPKEEGDEYVSTLYNVPGKRFVFSRRHAEDTIQSYLGICGTEEKLEALGKGDIEDQKKAWQELFADAAWKTPRILRDMNSDVASDFYSQKVGQVRLDKWSDGRVVLLGDAAYCPSPATGMGTTSSMTGAYVLAGEINKHCGGINSGKKELTTALQEYDNIFRPFITSVQTLGPGMPQAIAPETRWGISILHFVMWFTKLLGIDAVAQWFLRESNVWDLPTYDALDNLIPVPAESTDAKKTV